MPQQHAIRNRFLDRTVSSVPDAQLPRMHDCGGFFSFISTRRRQAKLEHEIRVLFLSCGGQEAAVVVVGGATKEFVFLEAVQ